MKRFHVHVGVKNLSQAIEFYSAVFGEKPTKVKDDYAKWMLDDPRINFAISTRANDVGLDHLGIQVDEDAELKELTERLKKADLGVYDEGTTTCCYAESNKTWIKDPAGIAWETYQTMADVEIFKETRNTNPSACCPPKQPTTKSCC